jgi:hypothetical protein
MTFGWNQCRMCGRHLSSEEDPLSGDCGGECWGCVGFIEAEIGYEPSQEAVRREIEAGLRETAAALNLRLFADARAPSSRAGARRRAWTDDPPASRGRRQATRLVGRDIGPELDAVADAH